MTYTLLTNVVFGSAALVILLTTLTQKSDAIERALNAYKLALGIPFFFLFYFSCTGGAGIQLGVLTAGIIVSQLLFILQQRNGHMSLQDILAVFIPWLLLDYRLLGRTHASSGSIDWALYCALLSAFIIANLRDYRRIRNLGLSLRPKVFYMVYFLQALFALAAIIIPAGLLLGVIRLPLHASTGQPILELIVKTGVAFLTVAMYENIVFLAGLYKYLCNSQSRVKAAIIMSLIFGSLHLHKPIGQFIAPNWRYAIAASIAVLVYCWLYQKTRSIFWPTLLHALTNSVWSFMRP